MLRLFRILRLFKLANQSRQLRMVGRALIRAREGIYLLGFIYGCGVVIASTSIFYAELSFCTLQSDEVKFNNIIPMIKHIIK